jgi:hypothetical protein
LVKVLDLRMVEKYVILGHTEEAVNIPVVFPKYQWHVGKRKNSMWRLPFSWIARISPGQNPCR